MATSWLTARRAQVGSPAQQDASQPHKQPRQPHKDAEAQPAMRARGGDASDAQACAAIYAPYVHETAITFETVPPPPQEMGRRIAAAAETHAWLVLEHGERVVGYAYGGELNRRAAYRWSCEVSVYVE